MRILRKTNGVILKSYKINVLYDTYLGVSGRMFGRLFLFTMFLLRNTSNAFHIPFRGLSNKRISQIMQAGTSRKREKTMALWDVPKYQPVTPNQRAYVDALENSCNSLVFGIGPAGCGKTLFACIQAIKLFRLNKIRRIVITRPVISVEEDLGFLPGNIMRKMDPWLQPIFDTFLEYYSQRELDDMIANGTIEIAPLGFMRGRTFKHALVIADEMQNSTPNQMLMLLTRIGENSRMIVTGDLCQSDIRGGQNGLADFYEKFSRKSSGKSGISMAFLNDQDVQRSPIVRSILDIYSDNTATTETNAPADMEFGGMEAPSSYEPAVGFHKNSNDDAAMIPLSQISKNYE